MLPIRLYVQWSMGIGEHPVLAQSLAFVLLVLNVDVQNTVLEMITNREKIRLNKSQIKIYRVSKKKQAKI